MSLNRYPDLEDLNLNQQEAVELSALITEQQLISSLTNELVPESRPFAIEKIDKPGDTQERPQLSLPSKNETNVGGKKVWVYQDSNILFEEEFDPNQLTNRSEENGFVIGGTLTYQKDGATCSVRLELIKQKELKSREGVWVYANSTKLFEQKFDISELSNVKRNLKYGVLISGTLAYQKEDESCTVNVELISKTELRNRKPVSVYAGSTTIFEQKDDNKVWAYKDMNVAFKDEFDPNQLTNITRSETNGLITAGTLRYEKEGVTYNVNLEFITNRERKLSKRKWRWVYRGMSIPFTEKFDPMQLTDITRSTTTGLIIAGTFTYIKDGTFCSVKLEFISPRVQRHRKEVWVYAGGSEPFEEAFDPNQLTNTKIGKKNGLITEGTLTYQKNGATCSVRLELISSRALSHRKKKRLMEKGNDNDNSLENIDELMEAEPKNGDDRSKSKKRAVSPEDANNNNQKDINPTSQSDEQANTSTWSPKIFSQHVEPESTNSNLLLNPDEICEIFSEIDKIIPFGAYEDTDDPNHLTSPKRSKKDV